RPKPESQRQAAPAPVKPRLPIPQVIDPSPIRPYSAPERKLSSDVPSQMVTSSHISMTHEPGRWADLEERLGANWLNKIGTAAFVIGVALLLNYSMHYLGPRGKIGLGYVLSAIFLAIGILCERRERYRIAGRAVLGGGWALAYFTT